MGRKRLTVSPECLVQLLQHDGSTRFKAYGMPADARIVGVDVWGSIPELFRLEFLVESSTFPETSEPEEFLVFLHRLDEPEASDSKPELLGFCCGSGWYQPGR